MNNSCDTCKHASAKLEHFPCRACTHSYTDQWEKALLVAGLESLLGWQGWKFEGEVTENE